MNNIFQLRRRPIPASNLDVAKEKSEGVTKNCSKSHFAENTFFLRKTLRRRVIKKVEPLRPEMERKNMLNKAAYEKWVTSSLFENKVLIASPVLFEKWD